MAGGEISGKLNALDPSRYPARQMYASVTREQVKAELAAAVRSGDYMAGGEISDKCNVVHPNMHPAV